MTSDTPTTAALIALLPSFVGWDDPHCEAWFRAFFRLLEMVHE